MSSCSFSFTFGSRVITTDLFGTGTLLGGTSYRSRFSKYCCSARSDFPASCEHECVYDVLYESGKVPRQGLQQMSCMMIV